MRESVRLAVEAAVDRERDAFEIADVGEVVEIAVLLHAMRARGVREIQACAFGPEPGGRAAGVDRLLEELRMLEEIQPERGAAQLIVLPAGDLDQPAPLEARPIARAHVA